MSTIVVKEVKGRKMLKDFVKFQTKLYKNNPYFVPPLIQDELNFFSKKKNPSFNQCDCICFLAYKDKKIVLQSYIWMMPDAFIGLLPSDKQHDCKQIRKELQDEEIKFKMKIDEFIDNVLADCNISFEIKHYNDSEVLSAINNDPQFMQRYYLD